MTKATRESRRTLRSLPGVLVAGAVLVGVVVLGVFLGVSGVGAPTQADTAAPPLGDPNPKFAEARSRAPYAIREPVVPPGYELWHIEWASDPESAEVNAFSVDLFYLSEDGGSIHVWQTNISADALIEAGKDPVTSFPGEVIDIAGTSWRRGEADHGGPPLTTLNTRFSDGITVSIGSTLSVAELISVAQSLIAPPAPEGP